MVVMVVVICDDDDDDHHHHHHHHDEHEDVDWVAYHSDVDKKDDKDNDQMSATQVMDLTVASGVQPHQRLCGMRLPLLFFFHATPE